ncbi:MAG TPA: UbiA family prenyltransferase, partial [Phycisphaerales bacterium]|nr:UbiA family prenyltransferase [Phycisphaerales bacterium]
GNPWPLTLSVPVLLWIAFYSFTKRFTAACHLFLGGALAASPLAAGIAIDPSIYASTAAAPASTILFLSGMVVCWVAGFDVAYALQDLDFDRRTGLRSIPARLGVNGALWSSRALHLAAMTFLVFAWRSDPRFGALMLGAVIGVGVLLVYEHLVLARRGIAGLPLAFFTLNGVISVALGIAGCVDVVVN